jgi:hypothetical protein
VSRPEERDARDRRLRAALAAVLVKADAPELRLVHRWLDSWSGIGPARADHVTWSESRSGDVCIPRGRPITAGG